MFYVQNAQYLDGYRIQVTFSDGLTKVVDLAHSLTGSIFEPLQDLDFFKQFHLDPDSETLTWENGADIAPEYLYQNGVTISQKAQKSF